MLIGIIGLKGSGKDTVSNLLKSKYQFEKDSFATSLKDATSAIFGWDRKMLEGDTPEGRKKREEPDPWWTEQLGVSWSPRYALQYIGTDVLRNNFYDSLWLKTLENRVRKHPEKNIVVSDVRFDNEVSLIKKLKGKLIRVTRGDYPEWYDVACRAQLGSKKHQLIMENEYKNVHASEWDIAGYPVDYTVANDGSIEDLEKAVDCIAHKWNL